MKLTKSCKPLLKWTITTGPFITTVTADSEARALIEANKRFPIRPDGFWVKNGNQAFEWITK